MDASVLDPLSKQSYRAAKRPRLAIISTFDDLCGIAGYTKFLIPQLADYFEVEVFDLEQFFMRSLDPVVRKVADKKILEFCERLQGFDYINIQLEHGTLGRNPTDILRRFRWLTDAAPALSVTFHTILPQKKFPLGAWLGNILTLRVHKAAQIRGDYRTNKLLTAGVYRQLRKLQRKKSVGVIVHTRRDRRIMQYINGINHIFDHPLVFIPLEKVDEIRAAVTRDKFKLLASHSETNKYVGVFGFLSPYKGFDSVVRAMHRLPSDYHLLVFGGVHPHEIHQGVGIDPYVETLLKEAGSGLTIIDSVIGSARQQNVQISLNAGVDAILCQNPRDISNRIHFMGAQTDEQFVDAMAVCESVVLPYLEVGQSSSGVLAIALDLKCRVIAARNHVFLQADRYFPETIEFFDLGNVVELAERIKSPRAYPVNLAPNFTTHTNARIYVAANSPLPRRAGMEKVSPSLERFEPASI